MADVTLSELTNINPEVPNPPVIDNSHVVNELNQNGRFQAENTWRKYNSFLENKKDLFKNIGDIQNLDTLAEDNPVLKKQAADVLADILKDPSAVMGGRGYDEIQGKIAKYRSDAMASKQANLDLKANKMFLDRNPELYTDENKAAIQSEIAKPINARKSVMLQMPTILDTKNVFEGLVKDATHDYSEPITKDGVPYISSGKEINPNAIENAWNLIAKGGQTDKFGHDELGAVKYNFSKLPDNEKQKYQALSEQAKQGGEANATPEEMYWKDYGHKYLDAYFPQGSYTKTQEGNLRFAHSLAKDPYYLGEKELAEKTQNDKMNRAIEWAKLGLEREKLNKSDKEDLDSADSTINTVTGAINNGQEKVIHSTADNTNMSVIRVSDPFVLQRFATLDKEGKVINSPDAIDFVKGTNQVLLRFDDPKKPTGKDGVHHFIKTIPMDQRVWLKIEAAASNPNKDIGGVNRFIEKALKANNNSIYDISQKVKAQQHPTPQTKTDNTKKTTGKFDNL